jgi:hypothetical protein
MVAFIGISQALPAGCKLFSLNIQVPTLGCFPHFLISSMLNVHISIVNGMTIFLVANNSFHQVVPPNISVILCIYIFSNYIGIILITAAIWELILISYCVKH